MISKSVNPAPLGLDAIDQEEDPNLEPLEIEIEDPESVTIRQGDEELKIEPTDEYEGFADNLADEIPDSVLDSLASDLLADFESDVSARKDWVQTYVDGLELLGLKMEDRS
jgi:hypothetical protein